MRWTLPSLVFLASALVSAALRLADGNSEDPGSLSPPALIVKVRPEVEGEAAHTFLREAKRMGWQSEGYFPSGARIEMTFAVRQRNLDKLEQLFQEVSDPENPAYGKHLSFEEVVELTAPGPGEIKAVEDTLRRLGASETQKTAGGGFVVAQVSVEAAERTFGDRFHRLRHEDGRTAVRCPGGRVPKALRAALDFVMPLNEPLRRGGQMRPRSALDANLSSLREETPSQVSAITPDLLRELYGVGDAQGVVKTNKQAATGFLKQHYKEADLQDFFSTYYKKGKGRKVTRIVGDARAGTPGLEAQLDLQYLMAIGSGVETEFWSFAGVAPGTTEVEPFLKFMTTLANTSNAPLVISSSYGDDENSVSEAYAERCNVEFQKAGVRGISLLFASGDQGVGGIVGCSNKCERGQGCFMPIWPASSPYVTAVGGTTGLSEERAATLSSGGFSYRWPMPAWQRDAVEKSLAGGSLPDKSRFSQSGRGFPDISAQAIDYMIINSGHRTLVTGTSCSTPTVAGILSLVNDVRLRAGKSPLGFVNPLLYKNPGALNDVSGGCNVGCSVRGFCARPGWDAVTGLGTPNFARLAGLSAPMMSSQ